MNGVEKLANVLALVLSKRNFRGNRVTAVTALPSILPKRIETHQAIEPDVIQISAPVYVPQRKPLWEYLHIGRQMHGRSPKGYFVWQRDLEPLGRDYYSFHTPDRPLHTCALAAILAGIDGHEAISASLDFSAAVYRLSCFYDLDFERIPMIGIDGKKRSLSSDIMNRYDVHGWSRFHIQKMLQREITI